MILVMNYSDYEKVKTSKLHGRIIEFCKWYEAKIESDKNKQVRICLVAGSDIAYYFDGDKINFNNSIPSGGTLVTQQNKIIAMNANHYL